MFLEIFFLLLEIIGFEVHMRGGRMTQDISEKFDNLLESDILFSEFLLEEFLKNRLVIEQFFESTEESSESADLYQISEKILLVGIFVDIFEQWLHGFSLDDKIRFVSGSDFGILHVLGEIMGLGLMFEIFSQIEKFVVRLQKDDVLDKLRFLHENDKIINDSACHCEERSDVAICRITVPDCFILRNDGD